MAQFKSLFLGQSPRYPNTNADGLEVEFLSRDGSTLHIGTLSIGDVLVLNRERTRVA